MIKDKGIIARAFLGPDVEGYRENIETEERVYYRQFFLLRPLLMGALSILSENIEECDSCGYAHDLIKSFLDGMTAAEDAVEKTVCAEIPTITIDQLKKKLGKMGRADITVRVDERGVLLGPEGKFQIMGEGKFPWEIATEEREASKKPKSGKAA